MGGGGGGRKTFLYHKSFRIIGLWIALALFHINIQY